MRTSVIWGIVIFTFAVLIGIGYLSLSPFKNHSGDATGIPPEIVADYVHAVIEANRTVYATDVVGKLQEKGIAEAAEHWRNENSLPLPAQFLIETGRLVSQKETGVKYRLASLTPIYVWNGPETDFERRGLDAIAKDPTKPYTGYVHIGRERFFQAIYPDIAVTESCVACHNAHPNSQRRNFKLKDVMGGIVITIPLAQ